MGQKVIKIPIMKPFAEVFDEMKSILDKEQITVQDYKDFMNIPISDKYSQDEQEQLSWLIEGMQIRSAEIKSEDRSFLQGL
tara:strand:- start:7472 stop:7714 length:243 start_codon:yes stop_codon:yes gene_type:complete